MTYDIHDFLWATSNTIPYVAMKEGLAVGMREGYDRTTVQNDYTFLWLKSRHKLTIVAFFKTYSDNFSWS